MQPSFQAPTLTRSRTWTSWTLDDWNSALLEHYFGQRGGVDSPVRRIVVNGTELRRAINGSANDYEAEEAFLKAIRLPRVEFNRVIAGQHLRGGHWTLNDPPRFLSHLVLTCLAASTIEADLYNEGDFRERLAHLLGNAPNESYPLTGLPALWNALSHWLHVQRQRGQSLRRLELPTPSQGRRLIGHSVLLAFPARADEKTLASVLSDRAFGQEPPVQPVLKLVRTNSYKFSQPFQEAFARFDKAYSARGADLYDDPFWAAVRAAVTVELERIRAEAKIELQLVVELSSSGEYELYVVSDRPVGSKLGRLNFLESGATLGRFSSVVGSENQRGVDALSSAVRQLLQGTLETALPGSRRRQPLFSTVRDGVLLFQSNEIDLKVLATSRPSSGRVYPIIRDDLVGEFLAHLPAASKPGSQPSEYLGWTSLQVMDASVLSCFDRVHSGPLLNVRCLQPTVLSSEISVSGGVRVDGGYLGMSSLLPAIVAPGADDVQLVPQSAEPNSAKPLLLRRQSLAGGSSAFSITSDTALHGDYLLVSRSAGTLRARRKIAFRSYVLSCDYKDWKTPSDWIVESSGPAVVRGALARIETAASRDRVDVEPWAPENLREWIAEGGRPQRVRGRSWSVPPWVGSKDDKLKVEQFVQAAAALSESRQGITEPDFLELLRTCFLSPSAVSVWDLARSWIEAGAFERAAFSRWRGTRYFAQRPYFALSRVSHGVRGTLMGLASPSVRDHVAEQMENLGAQLTLSARYSTWSLPTWSWMAPSTTPFDETSRRLSLADSRWPRPLESFLVPIAAVASTSDDEGSEYALHSRWKWDEERFVPITVPSHGAEIEILQLRRSDRPTRYEIYRNAERLWITPSRTWALLFGYSLAGRPVFSTGDSRWLCRSVRANVYLPPQLGRWLVSHGNPMPGPITGADGKSTYVYTFSSDSDRSAAIELLWGITSPTALGPPLLRLVTLARHGARTNPGVSAYLPPSLLRDLAPHCAPEEIAQLNSLRVPHVLIPHFSNLVPRNRNG
jgi:hypothetical protein